MQTRGVQVTWCCLEILPPGGWQRAATEGGPYRRRGFRFWSCRGRPLWRPAERLWRSVQPRASTQQWRIRSRLLGAEAVKGNQMKIRCHCGATIYDQTDYLPHKAHVIPDQEWFDALDAIDDAIENAGPTPAEKEAACMKVRRYLWGITRLAWQCQECGRVYIDDQQNELRELLPASDEVPRELFRSRPSAEQSA